MGWGGQPQFRFAEGSDPKTLSAATQSVFFAYVFCFFGGAPCAGNGGDAADAADVDYAECWEHG